MKKILLTLWLILCFYLWNRVAIIVSEYLSSVPDQIDIAIKSNENNTEEIEKLKARVLDLEIENMQNDPELTQQQKAYLSE